MSRKCSASCCRYNYKCEKCTTVFKFSCESDRRHLWTKSVNKDNFERSPNTVVCIKYVEENFIIRKQSLSR